MDWKDPDQVREYKSGWYKKNKEKVDAYKRAYYQENKEKVSAYNKEYHQENKEKISERAKKYREKNREKFIEYSKEYYQNNKEKFREYHQENKDHRNKIIKVRKKNNPALVLQHLANRRARKIRAIPKWLRNCPVEKRRVYTVYLLSRLLAKADGIERHVDHMWPLSDGGPHWSGNLQVLTATDNMAKAAYSCPKLKKQMKLNLKEAKVLYAKAA